MGRNPCSRSSHNAAGYAAGCSTKVRSIGHQKIPFMGFAAFTASGDAGNSGGKKGHLANQPTYLYHMIFRYFIPVKCIAFSILVGIEA
jgi:hypothetical protein